MEIPIEQYHALNPLSAYLDQKSEVQRIDIATKFTKLSDTGRGIIIDTETVEKILALIAQGVIPETHGKAVAIMIALATFGDITNDQFVPLLEKLGLPNAQAQQTAGVMDELLRPLLAERQIEVPDMTELPPMTRPMEEGPKPLTPSVPKAKVPERNIIDLKQKT